jgi:predicted ATPase
MENRSFDGYELLTEIGSGGMGTVYAAVDRRTGERVAVKHLRADIANSDAVDRFRREGNLLRRLNHPNIVQLRDVCQREAQQYLVMEYVDGGSLRQMLDRSPRLSVHQALSLSIEIADALTRAHHLGIVHRDIKPANVLLAADGTPRLADFGIARTAEAGITATGAIVGTLDYLSPEVLRGQEADARADVWSFGVMLFEMVAGVRPFKGDHVAALFQSILNDPVPDMESLRAGLPHALIDLVYRMLAKDPVERLPSFRLVGAELEAIQHSRASGAPQHAAFSLGRDSTASAAAVDNLPAETTAFVGRGAEVAEVKRALAESRHVTIQAQGGTGKTRLALEVARQIARAFAHGVVFVPLARIESAEYLGQTIAEELRLSLSSQEDPKVQVIEALRPKQMLLVLDNFEHILGGRDLVQALLESARGLKVLTTSRERLNLRSEVVCHLTSMETAEWKTVDEALAYSAVQLFVQGARHARAGFALKQSDIAGLTRICRLVEGLPLAILLAAAWVDTLSLNEIAEEIEKNFAVLETDLHDAPEHQRSVRAVFESTWRRLSTPEQALFAKLSVFRASFGREAVQEVAGASLRGLATLQSKSLLTRDADSGRYHVHELLRQYAEEQLEQSLDTSRKTREAHSTFFATFMELRWSHLIDHRTATALREIKDDIENVRAAWRTWLERRDAGQLRKFLKGLWLAHETWGWFRPAIDLVREAGSSLEDVAIEPDGWASAHAEALAVEGWFMSLVGRPDLGITMARRSLDIMRRHGGDNLYLPTASVNINSIFLNLLDEAEAASQDMLASARRQDDRWQEAFGLVWMSYVEISKGSFADAERLAGEALAIFERLENPFGISVASGIVLGAVHMSQGRFEPARKAYERGLMAAASINYRRVIQLAHDSLGTIALLEGRIEDAHASFLKSLKITAESGQSREQLGSLRDIATIYTRQGRFEEAVELLAVVLHHPANEQNSLSRRESLKVESERLLGEIETTLSAERRQRAWECGASLELGTVVDALITKNPKNETGERTRVQDGPEP